MTEAGKKLEGAEHKKDSEEMPVWAVDMMKKLDSVGSRMDSMESRKDTGKAEEIKEGTDGERKDSDEEKAEKKEEKADRKDGGDEYLDADKKKDRKDTAAEEAKAEEKKREDSARADASLARQNRELQAKIAEMESRITGLYQESTFEDRNALAEIRARADGVYQAVSGRPASEPIPGESPIAYRKRMADGLRKFSAKFKGEQIGNLSGASFDVIESQIYADAQAAAKMPDLLPAGQLRAITRNDSGHTITEYIGDPLAAWEQFSTGAVMSVKFTKPESK